MKRCAVCLSRPAGSFYEVTVWRGSRYATYEMDVCADCFDVYEAILECGYRNRRKGNVMRGGDMLPRLEAV